MTEFEIFKIPIDAWGGTAFAALGDNWTNGAATAAEQPNVHDPDFANPNIISGDQVGNAIGNLYRAGSDLGFPSGIGEFLNDFGGLFQLFNLQQQWLQQYVPGVQPFSITMNP